MDHHKVTPADLQQSIRNVPDFPIPGIQFKDITPVLADARLFAGSIELLTNNFKPGDIDAVVGIDARGFIFAAAAALRLKAGFIPVRKKGKLPYFTFEQSYELDRSGWVYHQGKTCSAIHRSLRSDSRHALSLPLAPCSNKDWQEQRSKK
jgi:adenine/guanine phosphoribosyltransferase-like PRPP-binding protein